MSEKPKVLILVGSPRRNGNSAVLAESVSQGASESGATPVVRHIDDHISSFLRDCRQCRKADGVCSIDDRFQELFFDDFLPATGVVICSPVYWYGLSAQAKAFFDRTFCYYSASFPDSERVVEQMTGKKIGLVLASEETYPGASLGIVHQIQEYSRYTRSEFVGTVRGIGNSRGEVVRDPGRPESQAYDLGKNLLSAGYTDYCLDTERGGRVWSVPD